MSNDQKKGSAEAVRGRLRRQRHPEINQDCEESTQVQIFLITVEVA